MSLNPPLSLLAFIYVVAFQALMAGIAPVAFGWKIRQRTTREWILYVTGTLSILFGLSVLVTPVAGALSIVLLVASWALVTGGLRIMLALRARQLPVGGTF